MRINARLDEDETKQMEYLRKVTRLTPTDILKRAIALFYRQLKRQHVKHLAVLHDTGLIGCFAGEPDLSETYKAELTETIQKKI